VTCPAVIPALLAIEAIDAVDAVPVWGLT